MYACNRKDEIARRKRLGLPLDGLVEKKNNGAGEGAAGKPPPRPQGGGGGGQSRCGVHVCWKAACRTGRTGAGGGVLLGCCLPPRGYIADAHCCGASGFLVCWVFEICEAVGSPWTFDVEVVVVRRTLAQLGAF